MKIRDHIIISVILYVLSIQYLSATTDMLLSPLLPIYLLLTMIGAFLPDLDWEVMKIWDGFGHRNPVTHSCLFPLILFFLIHVNGLLHPNIIIADNAFTLGILSHLLGDLIKTGNLVWIPKRYENAWFFINSLVLIGLLYFLDFF